VKRLSHDWRGPRLMQMVAAGAIFKDGVLMETDQAVEVVSA
jgi:hypothetical protein